MSDGGKHRPAPPDDGVTLESIAQLAGDRRKASAMLETMSDKPRCRCGRGVLQKRPDEVPLPCAAPGCEAKPDVSLLSVETKTGTFVYFRRGGRLPGGAPLFWWESEPAEEKR